MGNIYGNGISQGDEYDLLVACKTSIDMLCSLLDDDAVVTATDYDAACAALVVDYTGTSTGRSWKDVIEFLQLFITYFNTICSKLDSDGAITAVNWASLWGLTDVIDSLSEGNIKKNGVNQGDLVYLYDEVITKINGINAKLDADPDVNKTWFAASGDITDNVDDTGCYVSKFI